MPTQTEADGDAVTVDTYCPACGGDAVPLLGRDCDCSLREDVVCSVVVEHPDREEPIRKTITDRRGLTDPETLAEHLCKAVRSASLAD